MLPLLMITLDISLIPFSLFLFADIFSLLMMPPLPYYA